jgi:hypothetical protein
MIRHVIPREAHEVWTVDEVTWGPWVRFFLEHGQLVRTETVFCPWPWAPGEGSVLVLGRRFCDLRRAGSLVGAKVEQRYAGRTIADVRRAMLRLQNLLLLPEEEARWMAVLDALRERSHIYESRAELR